MFEWKFIDICRVIKSASIIDFFQVSKNVPNLGFIEKFN